MKSKSIVLMVVSLGFGLIAAIGISQVMGNNGSGDSTVKRGQVLVAAVDLKHGDELTEEQVKIEHWPIEVIPETAVRDFEQLKHKKMTTRLSKSLPIMLGDIINASEFREITIPKGFKLAAIKVSAEETIGGLLQPGDRVDVIGVVSVRNQDPGSSGKAQVVSKTFLKNIEVYTVDGRLRSGEPREAGANGNAIVGVLVTEKQSELIVFVQKTAKLRLVMRGESDGDENDQVDFTDQQGFYDSVFGKAAVQSTGQAPQNQASFTTKIWNGDQFQEVKFVGETRLTPIESPAILAEDADFEDFDHSEEIESGLEEDQYPGE